MRVPVALALGALALYLMTAATTITWQHGGTDGAELSAAALVLGVAHPPGYPLYLLLGHLFTYLPVGEVAFRVGLLSAVSASVGVGLAAYLAGRLALCLIDPERRPKAAFSAAAVGLAAAAAGACLACAPLYWSQAVIQEVYALHAALVLGALVLLERWKPGKDRLLAALVLSQGEYDMHCHAERSEASPCGQRRSLRKAQGRLFAIAQDDTYQDHIDRALVLRQTDPDRSSHGAWVVSTQASNGDKPGVDRLPTWTVGVGTTPTPEYQNRCGGVLGLLLGLGLANHLTFVFLAAPAAIYLFLPSLVLSPALKGHFHWRHLMKWWLPIATFLLGLSIYIYLPLRAMADPPLNWGDPSTLPRFLDHVAAASYRGYFGGRPAVEVLARVPVVARVAIDQLTWPGLLLAFVGLAELAWWRPAFFKLLLGYMLLTLLFALLYNAQGGEVYLLPLVLVLAVGLGVGVASLAQLRWGTLVAIILLLAIPSWQIWTHIGAMDLSGDRSAATYARSTLEAADPGATLYTDRDEQTFALWYVQVAEGLRPDVVVVDRRLLAIDWYRGQLERRHPGLLKRLVP